MPWYSLLPPYLTVVETWIIRVCIFLAILNFSPWFLPVILDLFLYIARRLAYELPIWGGRAQGRRVPTAPDLTETHRRRGSSLMGIIASSSPSRGREHGDARDEGLRPRHGHARTVSGHSIPEEDEAAQGE